MDYKRIQNIFLGIKKSKGSTNKIIREYIDSEYQIKSKISDFHSIQNLLIQRIIQLNSSLSLKNPSSALYASSVSKLIKVIQLYDCNEFNKAAKLSEKILRKIDGYGFLNIEKLLTTLIIPHYYWNNDNLKLKASIAILTEADSQLIFRSSVEELFLKVLIELNFKNEISKETRDQLPKIINLSNKFTTIPTQVSSQYYFLLLYQKYLTNEIKVFLPEFGLIIKNLYKKNKTRSKGQISVLLGYLLDLNNIYSTSALGINFVRDLKKDIGHSLLPANNLHLILLAISSGKYKLIQSYYYSISKEKFTSLKYAENIWILIKTSVKLLINFKKVSQENFPNIRFLKEHNELSLSKRDNFGLKITLYVQLITHALLNHKFQNAELRIKSFGKYCKRVLKGSKSNFRDIAFQNFLRQIPQALFNKRNLPDKITLPGKEKVFMDSNFFKLGMFQHEIIPYEDLWEMIIEILPNKPIYV